MSYQIIENDVRLLRRALVALQYDDRDSYELIVYYLRKKGLNFLMPEEQAEGQRFNYYARMTVQEIDLSEKFGCVLLPTYSDCIFLNPDWKNPRTLYVRLVEKVRELGEIGDIFWSPDPGVQEGLAAGSDEFLRNRKKVDSKSKKKRFVFKLPWTR